MTELIGGLELAWQATTTLEFVSVVFGLAYVILAARENIWCWPAAFIGTGTGILVFWNVSLLMESALNVFYLIMAVYGGWQWRYGGDAKTTLSITSWSTQHHLLAILAITLLTLVSGFLLSNNTAAAIPYVDAFTTWSAVIATWMVAKKILQNWLYWIVIDSVSVWLFLQRDLYLYALLFVAYTMIAAFGYVNWRARVMRDVLA